MWCSRESERHPVASQRDYTYPYRRFSIYQQLHDPFTTVVRLLLLPPQHQYTSSGKEEEQGLSPGSVNKYPQHSQLQFYTVSYIINHQFITYLPRPSIHTYNLSTVGSAGSIKSNRIPHSFSTRDIIVLINKHPLTSSPYTPLHLYTNNYLFLSLSDIHSTWRRLSPPSYVTTMLSPLYG
jgi:hypothetical protein